jgi:polyferredoxin
MKEKMNKRGRLKNILFTGVRNKIQWVILMLTLATGIQFHLHVIQALGEGPITIERPAGVEGFLPIGALMGWKYFFTTGTWDSIHPASMVFLGFAFLISFLLRKAFCSWFCPVGALSEGLWKWGESFREKPLQPPPWVDIPLRSVKYLLLGFFVYVILQMSPADIRAFFESPYYKIADVKMLYFFTKISALSATVLLILGLLSFFIRNFWCRYACPYGALMGLAAIFSPSRIRRNTEACIHCDQCSRACPFHLPVSGKQQIRSPECTGCLDCVNICPAKDALVFKTLVPSKSFTPSWMGGGILTLFAVLVYVAGITGHWKSMLPEPEFRTWLRQADAPDIQHPSVQFEKR